MVALSAGATPTPTASPSPAADNLVIHNSRVTGLATFITSRDGQPIPVGTATARPATARTRAARTNNQPARFLDRYGRLFGVTDPASQLRRARITGDSLGQTHSTYRQFHNGIPVFSGMLKLHQNAAADVVAANGDFYPIPTKVNTTPTLSSEAAVAIASASKARGDPTVERAELVIVDPGWYGDPAIGARLAYHIILTDPALPSRQAFFVDAHTGAILDRWNLLPQARERRVYTGLGGSSLPGMPARSEGESPVTSPVDVNRAYDYAGDIYDYFSRAFGRDSIDDAGMAMVLTVDSNYPSCPNALWTRGQMVFCAGTVTDDIAAHEMAHGITELTADLIYQNQSGQLNESFSDILGELVDLFNGDAAFPGPPGGSPSWPTHLTGPGVDTPNNLRSVCSLAESYVDGVRWLIGEDAASFGGAIRDMWDPTCFGHPDWANSDLAVCPAGDNGGVHIGSGIPNHAFAILTDGKFFNGFAVNGIGPIKAAAVWYRALTVYMAPSSDFRDAYLALNQAAQDLIGTTPLDPRTGDPSGSVFTAADAAEVDKALLAVEMDTDGACGASVDILNSDPPTQCLPRVTVYSADFEDGAPCWTVSHTPPQHPDAHPYDWVLTSGLPFARPGTAWFCDDPTFGDDCQTIDGSAVHYLQSPPITMPAVLDTPTLAFTHYMASETRWDGGNIEIRVDGGPWLPVPSSAFDYNPYNTTIITQSGNYQNPNPLAGQPAWSGVGGHWGTSLVDLSGYVSGSETIEVRFNFGKDACNGVAGWFIDDFEVYVCACNTADDCLDDDLCTADTCEMSECAHTPTQCIDITGTDPPTGVVDARQPHALNDAADTFGWDSIDVELSDPSGVPPDSFTVTVVGENTSAPCITAVSESPGVITLTLSSPMEPDTWTVVAHQQSVWSACVGILPADVDGNATSSADDIAALIASIASPPGGELGQHATDINRSGITNALDILREIDLLNGAGAFSPWINQQLPPNPCN